MRHMTRSEMERVYNHILGERLPGAEEQGVVEESATQKYKLGSRLQLPGGRIYRYAQADADRQLRAAYGVFPQMDYAETGPVAATSPVGTRVVTCTAVADVAENEYAEGYMEVWGAAEPNFGVPYKIKTNTAATAGNTFTVNLYDRLFAALTIAVETVTLYHNPYRRVVSMRQRQIDGVATDWRKVSCIGVPNIFVQAGYFCWIQTWGPCVVVGDSGTEGIADSERCMQFGDNLDMLRLRDLGDGLGRHQIAGFVLPPTTSGVCPGLYFLQIAP